MKNVLHIINGEHYSGAERVQDLLAGAIEPYGYRVHFATLKSGAFDQNRRAQASPLTNFNMGSKFDVSIIRPMARYAREHNIALLHAHTPRSLMVGRLLSAATGLPLVYHLHSPAGNDSTRKLTNKINALIENLSLRGVTAIISVSSSLRAYLPQRFQGITEVIENGVPLREQSPAPTSAKPVLGVIALFRPRKGLEVLVEACALLAERGKPFSILAVGGFETPEYEAKIRGMIRERQLDAYFHWTGFTRDVGQHIANMHFLVLPSTFGEGMPMVVLEAMSQGVPIIATRVEGVPEVVRDGQEGVLAEPGNARQLADLIAAQDVSSQHYLAMRNNAYNRQRQHFSDDSLAKNTASVYDKVLHHE